MPLPLGFPVMMKLGQVGLECNADRRNQVCCQIRRLAVIEGVLHIICVEPRRNCELIGIRLIAICLVEKVGVAHKA